jgi:hypothetical protein
MENKLPNFLEMLKMEKYFHFSSDFFVQEAQKCNLLLYTVKSIFAYTHDYLEHQKRFSLKYIEGM